MIKAKKIFLIIISVTVIGFVAILINLFITSQKVQMLTDKNEYKIEESLKVKIKNNLIKNICFSSCYPYYLEEKVNDKWQRFEYPDCEFPNLNNVCIGPRKTKVFEILLSNIGSGVYRIVSAVCIGCDINAEFREKQWLFSNEFIVK